MRFRLYITITIISALCLTGCLAKNDGTDRQVASVGDAVLTVSRLCASIPSNSTREDSAVIADEYIRRWVNQQVVLQKAELNLNLSDEEIDIEEAVEEYRRALVVERYQQRVVEQKFKPNITDEEISEYYEAMKENFRLNESIMKGVMCVIPKDVPDLKKFKKWLQFSEDDDFSNVEEFLFANSKNYSLSLDKWITVSSVKKFIPLVKQPADTDIKKGKLWEFSDDENIYYLIAMEVMMVDDYAPTEYVRDKIYTILLNKKKIEFIRRLSADLYNEALQNNLIKYYNDER